MHIHLYNFEEKKFCFMKIKFTLDLFIKNIYSSHLVIRIIIIVWGILFINLIPDILFSTLCSCHSITNTLNSDDMQILVEANTSILKCHVCPKFNKFDIVHFIKYFILNAGK